MLKVNSVFESMLFKSMLFKSMLFKSFSLSLLVILLSHCGDIINLKYWRKISMGSYVTPVKGPEFHLAEEIDPLNATVYFYRPFSDWADQELQAPSLFIQNQLMFGIKNNMYVALELEPGRHVFSARRPLAILHVEKIFELEIDVDSGGIYYLRYSEVDVPPELSFQEGYVSNGPVYQVDEEFAKHELRLTHSIDEDVQKVARDERCKKNRDLIYSEGEDSGVEEDEEGKGWSFNWRSYLKLGSDC